MAPSSPSSGGSTSRGRGTTDSLVSTTPRSSITSTRSSSCSSRPKIYSCDYEGCDKVYSRPSLLTQHQRAHTDSRPFCCGICDSAFYREDHLKRHMLSHTTDKPFKCSVCGKGVNTKQHLKRHEVTHTKSFRCEYEDCEEAFYKHPQLRHHIQSVHLKTLTCDECGKTFPRPYRLANHKEKHHGASPAYQCDFTGCLLSFKTWSSLQLHTKTDHPKLKCSICGKPCVREEGLRMHMLVHDEEKSVKLWKCTECPNEFLKKDELINHCNNDHGFIPSGLRHLFEEQRLKTLNNQEQRVLSNEKVEVLLKRGDTAVNMLFKTVASPQKEITCKYKNCARTFKKEYDLKRHLDWHDKRNSILLAGKNNEAELATSESIIGKDAQQPASVPEKLRLSEAWI